MEGSTIIAQSPESLREMRGNGAQAPPEEVTEPQAPQAVENGIPTEERADALAPFAGLEHAFAADEEPRTESFTLYGKPCFIEFSPMDAHATALYEQVGQLIKVDTTRRTVEEARVEEHKAEQELCLLVYTVTDYVLWGNVRTRGGRSLEEMKCRDHAGRPVARDVRETHFKSLTPAFRRAMIRVAKEVNHLNP